MKKTEEELEMVLATKMLDCLDSAIDEAEESRQRIKSGEMAECLRPESFYLERLKMLDQEIENLEILQQKILDKISQNTALSN